MSTATRKLVGLDKWEVGVATLSFDDGSRQDQVCVSVNGRSVTMPVGGAKLMASFLLLVADAIEKGQPL